MNRIYWDAMLFVYLIEANQLFAPQIQQILERMEHRGDKMITSIFTLGEVLTGPQKSGATQVAARIKSWFAGSAVELLPFDEQTAERYSLLRATYKVSQADAIHLATASLAAADVFLTNDKALHKLVIPGIRFVVGLDGTMF